MKLGFAVPTFAGTIDVPLGAAAEAERVGADAVFAVDHQFPPGRPDRPSFEAFSLLAAVAASSTDLRVGPLVARVGMRPTGLLAKQASSLHGLVAGGAIWVWGWAMPSCAPSTTRSASRSPVPRTEPPSSGRPRSRCGRCSPVGRGRGTTGCRRSRGLSRRPAAPRCGSAGRAIASSTWRPRPPTDGTGGVSMPTRSSTGSTDFSGRHAPPAGTRVRSCRRGAGSSWSDATLQSSSCLEGDRSARGVAWDPWRGTVDDLRVFATRLASAGAAWFVCLPAGPADRTELIARTLRDA